MKRNFVCQPGGCAERPRFEDLARAGEAREAEENTPIDPETQPGMCYEEGKVGCHGLAGFRKHPGHEARCSGYYTQPGLKNIEGY